MLLVSILTLALLIGRTALIALEPILIGVVIWRIRRFSRRVARFDSAVLGHPAGLGGVDSSWRG